MLICMLAAYLTWHLRQAWAPLTYTDEEPPARRTRRPRRRSASAEAKASASTTRMAALPQLPRAARHLGTLTRNDLCFAGTPPPSRPHHAHPRTAPGLRAHRGGHPLTLRK